MAKSFSIYTHMNTGEISDRLKGRVDLDKYKHACETLENFVVLPEGGVQRRSGIHYVSTAKSASAKTRLIPFQFTDDQAYVIEFGNEYCRFYKDDGRIESGGSPVEIATTYETADLFDLMFAQSADTMFIAHRDFPPRQLTRSSHTSWAIADVAFTNAPESFASVSSVVTNGSFDGMTGWTTISGNDVVSAGNAVHLDNTGANAVIEQELTVVASTAYNVSFFFMDHTNGTSTDQKLTVQVGSTAGATNYLAATEVDIGIHEFSFTPSGTAAFLRFSIVDDGTAKLTTVTARRASGGTDDANTYPGAVTFYEQRLIWAGSYNNPQTFWGSQTGSYTNMDSGTAEADHSIQFTVAADALDSIVWIGSSRDLLLGSYGGEHTANGGVENAISPASINITFQSSFGSERVVPQNAGNALLFLSRGGKKVREMIFNFDVDGFKAPDMTLLAAHVTNNGVTDMAYQQDPNSICWCSTTDGELIGMTYLPDQNVVAWHRHPLPGTRAFVESVACIPDVTNKRDQVWVSVKYEFNGSTARYIGYLDPDMMVDHGLTLDSPKTITAATRANPVVITSASHGFSNGDEVDIENVIGMTELNNIRYTVSGVTTNTFELESIEPTPVDIDGTGYTAYVSDGEARLCVTTLSGLTHLEGESIDVVDRDTIVHSGLTVSSGSVTIPNGEKVSRVYAGLSYTSTLKPVRPEFGSPQGMTQGKRKRWNKLGLRMTNTLGGTVNGDNIEYLDDRVTMDRGVSLFSGDKMIDTTDWDPDGFITVIQTQPLPMMIHAVYGDLDIGEVYGADE